MARPTQETIDRHRRLKSWFWQEQQRQAANRYQMAIDEDYYDSIQYLPEEARAILARGQAPVAWNEAKPTVDWLIGTERRTRTDFKIISRSDDSEEADADARRKTKLLKYLDDVNRTGFERSAAFAEALKGGLGWIELGVRGDPEQDPVYARAESWRNILYDSLGPRLDLDDSRYLFRFRWLDLDVAKAYFPGQACARILEAAAGGRDEERYMEWFQGSRVRDFDSSGGYLPQQWTQYDASAWLSNPRERVMLIEAWHKEPSKVTTGRGGGLNDRSYMRMRLSIMTEEAILPGYDDWSPYRHNRFPFIPLWCYRRKRDNAPYGVIRPIRGPQDALNKSMSKSIWEASANQVALEKDAVDAKIMTADQIRDEANDPNGMIILASGGLEKFKSIDRQDKVNAHMLIVERAGDTIRSSAGVTPENRGMDTNAQSGKAVNLKQQQGETVTAELFDNLLMARQMEGEITLSLCEQYQTEPKVFSVAGDRGKFEYERINMIDPETGERINDITARSANFVIGEQAWRQNLMQANFESMMELLGQMASISPEVVKAMLASVLELADMPNKKTMIRSVRQALGQPDPDEPMTPEQSEALQRSSMLDRARFDAELAGLKAEVVEAQKRGEKMDAEAVEKRVRAIYQAMQAAQVLATVPQVAPSGDEILRSAGHKDAGGDDPNLPAPSLPAAPLPELQQADGVAAGIETERADGIRV